MAKSQGYKSKLADDEQVIDDSYPLLDLVDPIVDDEQMSRGMMPRDWQRDPFCGAWYTDPFPSNLIIPRDEWDDRIEQMEKDESRLTDLCDQAGLTVLNQNGTNYCWINAPVHCVEVRRIAQGQELVRLSPASCGGPIKRYRNVGGWGTEGLRYIVEHGIVPQELWPPNAINRRYDTAETREERKKFMVYEWWEGRPRSLDVAMSMVLQRFPAAVGLNWWSHEITYMDPVALGNRKYGIRINNSWGTGWKDRGRSILSGSRVLPDDIVCPRTTTPSAF